MAIPELAEASYRARQKVPPEPFDEIASRLGVSARHAANLARLRAKLCPSLWERFVQSDDVRLKDLIPLLVLPVESQEKEYERRKRRVRR